MEAAARIEYRYSEEQERQDRYDLQTEFSELIDGSMHTEFDLTFNGLDVVGPDGRGLDEVTKNGLDFAKREASRNPNLLFGIRRANHERDERSEIIDMAKGNGPNTMIVISDFPQELMHAKKDVGGYNVSRKQTMLRVLIRQSNGIIKLHSQTLDGSDRQALEAIYGSFNECSEAGELLGQRIRTDLSPKEQTELIGRLVGIYDDSLSTQFGNQFFAGRRPADIRNTYDFVCKQHDIIETYVKLKQKGEMTDEAMYNAAALMQKRFDEAKVGITNIMPRLPIVNSHMLSQELIREGDLARERGQSYSACGSTFSPERFNRNAGFLEAGYGSQMADDEGTCIFKSKMCPECKATNVITISTSEGVKGACGCFKVKKKK
jgi:hypothetical protein